MVNKVEEPHNDNSDTELEQPNHKKVKLNKICGGSKVRSWIWKYFEPGFKEGVRYAVCQVAIIVRKKCEKTYKVGTSTSNCSEHLANIHGITKEQEEANVDAN
ncbi:11729_t:CDS:2 [Funneliformis mosseae]|uniref:11729_t:CDS:1 n=1 Tax=Funneliformis mosseae TaxID=27381 RepID=A0A9N9D2G7_FUNMO|nr:11729_t:CDS:2 [Funneliformis mosseae]